MSFQKTAAFVPSLSYEISRTKAVGFVLSRDFTVGQFCSITQSQWRWALFCHELSEDGWFCSFALLLEFEDKGLRFCSVMRSQWRSALFCHELSKDSCFCSFSLLYKISMTKAVGFVWLIDLSGFWLCSVMSFQKTAGFVPSLSYEIS